MFRPPVNGLLMDTKVIRHFLFVQHSALAQPIVARGEALTTSRNVSVAKLSNHGTSPEHVRRSRNTCLGPRSAD